MINRLLVANRGEIARRIMRTARDLGIETAAVFSDADESAPFVVEADIAVRLPGRASAETYLNIDALLDAARAVDADAVHPGYGFLAENPHFAEQVLAAGLCWVGPSPEAMRAMALKREAKSLVAAAGVPLLPSADIAGGEEDWRRSATEVGYPLLVKASAGGGGRGMRVVTEADELSAAVSSARREAEAAFSDGTVFLERLVTGGRHVEVQVIGDTHGGLLHLFERECSVQRRHQKVLEESPSPGISDSVREAMYSAALAAAKAVGYTSAGTVEFLVSGEGDDAEFYFLEMNTRLQVEHPVTELVTGLDIVAMQLAVADGERLPQLQEDLARTGHAIEVRLVAEDPAAGWLPSSGRLTEFAPPQVEGVRWDTAVVRGCFVPAEYDSLLAKVIGYGRTRDQARQRLMRGLRGLRVDGVATNRDMLLRLLSDEAVAAGETTTDMLDNRPELSERVPLTPRQRRVHALAAVACTSAGRDRGAVGFAPRAWRVTPSPPPVIHLLVDNDDVYLRYRETTREPMGLRVEVLADPQRPDELEDVHDVALRPGPRGWSLELDGVALAVEVAAEPDVDSTERGITVTAMGRQSRVVEPARLPPGGDSDVAQGPSSPVPGTVVSVAVAEGDVVAAGETLIVLEAMKMEHRIRAESDAVVAQLRVSEGQSVDAHDVLVVLAAPDSTGTAEKDSKGDR
jgi:propionyl-CoA carboxylase alpha chain